MHSGLGELAPGVDKIVDKSWTDNASARRFLLRAPDAAVSPMNSCGESILWHDPAGAIHQPVDGARKGGLCGQFWPREPHGA